MSRDSGFNSPFLLGFDHLERVLDRAAKASAEGYPPYNIEQTAENRLRISLAVAGFAMNELAVTVEDSQLVVRGKATACDEERLFIHRGIAKRQFQRTFLLAEGIEIKGAAIDNGLLHIDLERPLVEPEVRTIEIRKSHETPVIGTDARTGAGHDKTIDIEADS